MLKASGHELYYYTWPSETSSHLYEIDFLISDGTKIDPIEVKSSGYKTRKSLDLFCEKFSSRINRRYMLYPKDLREEEGMTYLPAYMTIFLSRGFYVWRIGCVVTKISTIYDNFAAKFPLD